MKLIARADVVLALGTRLGPFGTLPQYGIDYWPSQAKIIQVDADAKMLGSRGSHLSVGICGRKAAAHALFERLTRKTMACIANAPARRADVNSRGGVEAELDGWTHEKDRWSLEAAKHRRHVTVPDAARARAGR